MSMTTELAQRMKAAALNATPGPWSWKESGVFGFLSPDGVNNPSARIIDDGSSWGEYAETISPDSDDAKHIALANPANVLALVEALDASKQDAAKWFKAFEKAVSVGARYEERIAELEAREPDLYLCRVKGDEELYSPCGKDYPRGRGYYTNPPSMTVKLPAYPEPSDPFLRMNMKAVRALDVEALRAAGVAVEGE